MNSFRTSGRRALLILLAGSLLIAIASTNPMVAAEPQTASAWVEVSGLVMKKLEAENAKLDWPGGTAGVTVDPSTGDVFMIVPGQGIWKSSDRGETFARSDKGEIGGRCETGYSLNADPNGGGRVACFMLDGKAGITLDGGKTWRSFADVGRNWDYAAVDWSADDPKAIFAALHESGGKYHVSIDGGRSWTQLGEDPVFDDKGGVGIFDERTLVMTKGDGILRSTDAGHTWATVSDHTPVGRVVHVYKKVAYWLGKDGLLVSTDRGATWHVQGKPVEASLGPYFGPVEDREVKQIVVGGAEGIFETRDGGETWKHVAALPESFDFPKPGWYSTVAWDPVHDAFYASRMSKPTYRLARETTRK